MSYWRPRTTLTKISRGEESEDDADLGIDPTGQVFLEETTEFLRKAIQEMRQIMDNACDHNLLSPIDRKDQYLLIFLRARRFDGQRAFALMFAYEGHRREQNLYSLTPNDGAFISDHKLLHIHDDIRDKRGRQVLFFLTDQFRDAIQRLKAPSEASRALWYWMEQSIQNMETQQYGYSLVLDLAGLSVPWGYWGFTKETFEWISQVLTTRFPARVGPVYVLNEGWFFDALWKIVSLFVKPKIIQRVHFLGSNYEMLHDHIEKEFLPAVYGGTGPDLTGDVVISNTNASQPSAIAPGPPSPRAVEPRPFIFPPGVAPPIQPDGKPLETVPTSQLSSQPDAATTTTSSHNKGKDEVKEPSVMSEAKLTDSQTIPTPIQPLMHTQAQRNDIQEVPDVSQIPKTTEEAPQESAVVPEDSKPAVIEVETINVEIKDPPSPKLPEKSIAEEPKLTE